MNYEADSLQAKSEQQKIIFENVFIPTVETYREHVHCTISSATIITSYIFGALCTLLAMVFTWAHLRGDMGSGILIIVTIFFFLAVFFFLAATGRKRTLKSKLKYARILNSGKEGEFAVYENYFYNDQFTISQGMSYQYGQISKLLVSKDYLFIDIEETLHTAVKKDSFTVGDYESFVVFLREKFKEMDKAHLWVKLVEEN